MLPLSAPGQTARLVVASDNRPLLFPRGAWPTKPWSAATCRALERRRPRRLWTASDVGRAPEGLKPGELAVCDSLPRRGRLPRGSAVVRPRRTTRGQPHNVPAREFPPFSLLDSRSSGAQPGTFRTGGVPYTGLRSPTCCVTTRNVPDRGCALRFVVERVKERSQPGTFRTGGVPHRAGNCGEG